MQSVYNHKFRRSMNNSSIINPVLPKGCVANCVGRVWFGLWLWYGRGVQILGFGKQAYCGYHSEYPQGTFFSLFLQEWASSCKLQYKHQFHRGFTVVSLWAGAAFQETSLQTQVSYWYGQKAAVPPRFHRSFTMRRHGVSRPPFCPSGYQRCSRQTGKPSKFNTVRCVENLPAHHHSAVAAATRDGPWP